MHRTRGSLKEVVKIALLAAFIIVTGSFKLPGIIPGTEFQLSAPVGVAIAANFGFKRYFLAGLVASLVLYSTGVHNFVNVIVSIVFRLVAGGIVAILGPSFLMVTVAGPLGSAAARLILAGLLHKGVIVLLVTALPGMLYTALTAWPLTRLMAKAKEQIEGGTSFGGSGI